jgi:FecR protein
MGRRVLAGALILAEVLMLLLVVAIGFLTLGGNPGVPASPPMILTVFTGTATVQRVGSSAAVAAHSGDGLFSGDTVSTGTTGKASISYPDGSTTRLDSATTVKVSAVRAKSGALQTSFKQSAGLTWNKVQRLVGLSTFRASGPNSATAEVRGTAFGFYVEHEATGAPVVWIDTWSGSVLVGGTGGSVLAGTGQRVTVRAGAPPTVPVPIPVGDRQLSFTVFNQTLDGITGKPVAFQTGTLSTANGTPYHGVVADGKSDLQFVLGWPGSLYELTVVDPDGKVFAKPASTNPPINVVVPLARAGTWQFSVRDIQSTPDEAWWVVVGRS